MGPYEPKRFDWQTWSGAYSIGFALATETYANENGMFRDFYFSLYAIVGSLHIVFWRHRITN